MSLVFPRCACCGEGLVCRACQLRQVADDPWIPVSERLPDGDPDDPLLVLAPEHGDYPILAIYSQDEGEWIPWEESDDRGGTLHVAHWMPMPPPPRPAEPEKGGG